MNEQERRGAVAAAVRAAGWPDPAADFVVAALRDWEAASTEVDNEIAEVAEMTMAEQMVAAHETMNDLTRIQQELDEVSGRVSAHMVAMFNLIGQQNIDHEFDVITRRLKEEANGQSEGDSTTHTA